MLVGFGAFGTAMVAVRRGLVAREDDFAAAALLDDTCEETPGCQGKRGDYWQMDAQVRDAVLATWRAKLAVRALARRGL